ncbi:hypothetical protein GYA49_00300 [Candidatus Beckwithbacteria bacterium]|nr:hypothetical protein [Candidatus Beckwithbacteria bacterium]
MKKKSFLHNPSLFLKQTASAFKNTIVKHSIPAFFSTLLILLLLVIGSSYLNRSEEEPVKSAQTKTVSVYHVGKAPRLNFQAKVDKKGVLTVVAQSGGIVQNIYHQEGESVSKGTWLIALSSNYQGASVASLQRQLAQTQYDHINATYDTQKEIIAKQRDLANKSDENSDELRSLADQTLTDLKDQLSTNEDILNIINDNIKTLEEHNDNAVNDSLILETKILKSQYLAGVDELKSAIRTAEYQVDDDNPPAQLSNISKDVTLRQLDLQEKALDLSKEVSRLSLAITQVAESLMYPAAPFSGRIEKVYVQPGQAVAAGTPIALISGDVQNNVALISLSDSLAKSVSQMEPSIFTIGNQQVSLYPSYISKEATDGQLYTVFYNLPNEYCSSVTDGQYLSVSIPIGYPDTGSAIPYVPIDAVSQTQTETVLYVAVGDKVEYRNVKLGNVFGRFVEISKGLKDGDVIILDRTVVSGDTIKYER